VFSHDLSFLSGLVARAAKCLQEHEYFSEISKSTQILVTLPVGLSQLFCWLLDTCVQAEPHGLTALSLEYSYMPGLNMDM